MVLGQTTEKVGGLNNVSTLPKQQVQIRSLLTSRSLPLGLVEHQVDINDIDVFWNENIHKGYSPVEHGGRSNAKNILSNLKNFKEYNVKRDTLSYNTTRLSAHLNFGTISEREFYEELISSLGSSTQLINQIIWRNYFLTLNRFLPMANSYDLHIDPRFNKLKWLDNYTGVNTQYKSKRNQQAYDEWQLMMDSKTGFLIVDAAIQEIKTTGFMHNIYK